MIVGVKRNGLIVRLNRPRLAVSLRRTRQFRGFRYTRLLKRTTINIRLSNTRQYRFIFRLSVE